MHASPAWPPALAALVAASDSLDDDDALALRLISEKRAGTASPWAAWLASLPTHFDTPLFWPRDERVALLDGTNAALLTDLLEKRLVADWDGGVAPLLAQPQVVKLAPHLANVVREDYVWALSVRIFSTCTQIMLLKQAS